MMNEKDLSGLFKSTVHSVSEFGYEINDCCSVPDRVTNFISNTSACPGVYRVPEWGRYFWSKIAGAKTQSLISTVPR
jgi:hypothetical protein